MSIDEHKDEEISFYSTFLQTLSSETSSVYDLIDQDDLLNGVDPDSILVKHKPQKPSILPYAKINDLNNSKNEPNVNKPKGAVEIGLKIEF